jgi:tetratricopeptide (TPR) repeat protein
MRRAPLILVVIVLSACAGAVRRPPADAATAARTASARMTEADALVREGCFDCLLEAYQTYDAARTSPRVADAATDGAARAATLLALRERELGMVDDGYVAIARRLLADRSAAPATLMTILEIADVLPPGSGARLQPPSSDAQLAKSQMLWQHTAAWMTFLRERAPDDLVAGYAWLSLACGSAEGHRMTAEALTAPVASMRDVPIIAYRRAICLGIDRGPLTALAARDPRFREIDYHLGLEAIGRRDLDAAAPLFERAFDWRPQWPAVTLSIANLAMTAEEFDEALNFYTRTLVLDPEASDALFGQVRALTYLHKSTDAIAATDRLLALRWYRGDAYYWRALNETELERYDEGWADIEEAAKLLVNADVPKLAGILAYRRHHPDVAQRKFEESRDRNSTDCETAFYLGIVLGDERLWPQAAEVLLQTAACLQNAVTQLEREIADLRVSSAPEARRTRQIAKREQQIAAAGRMLATSWFNTAIAYYNLSRPTEARQYAEKVLGDEQFGERARDLLSRLGK